MINRKHIHIHIVLISVLLLIGQFGALIHSEQHPFHISDQSCDTFLALDHSKSGLLFDNIQLLIIPAKHILPRSVFVDVFTLTQTVYSARAPPQPS